MQALEVEGGQVGHTPGDEACVYLAASSPSTQSGLALLLGPEGFGKRLGSWGHSGLGPKCTEALYLVRSYLKDCKAIYVVGSEGKRSLLPLLFSLSLSYPLFLTPPDLRAPPMASLNHFQGIQSPLLSTRMSR